MQMWSFAMLCCLPQGFCTLVHSFLLVLFIIDVSIEEESFVDQESAAHYELVSIAPPSCNENRILRV